MDEMHEAAQAYFNGGNEQLKQQVWSFFSCMDMDGDGRVSKGEFMEFQRQRGYGVNSDNCFMELDTDHNGYLDFNEVLVFYYIVQVGRRSCNGCKALLKGLYFTCVGCFDSGYQSYDLCSTCYRQGRYHHHHHHHHHQHHAVFLDNHAMLMSKKHLSSAGGSANTRNPSMVMHPPWPHTSTVHPPRKNSWEQALEAFEAFEMALNYATFAYGAETMCGIL